jgi:hypothetical protein
VSSKGIGFVRRGLGCKWGGVQGEDPPFEALARDDRLTAENAECTLVWKRALEADAGQKQIKIEKGIKVGLRLSRRRIL